LLFSSVEAFANHSDFEEAVCVLLDINLGDVSGIELRLRLKALSSAWLRINPGVSPISQSRSPRGR
jgi:FixJ family two-component response regulator